MRGCFEQDAECVDALNKHLTIVRLWMRWVNGKKQWWIERDAQRIAFNWTCLILMLEDGEDARPFIEMCLIKLNTIFKKKLLFGNKLRWKSTRERATALIATFHSPVFIHKLSMWIRKDGFKKVSFVLFVWLKSE